MTPPWAAALPNSSQRSPSSRDLEFSSSPRRWESLSSDVSLMAGPADVHSLSPSALLKPRPPTSRDKSKMQISWLYVQRTFSAWRFPRGFRVPFHRHCTCGDHLWLPGRALGDGPSMRAASSPPRPPGHALRFRECPRALTLQTNKGLSKGRRGQQLMTRRSCFSPMRG